MTPAVDPYDHAGESCDALPVTEDSPGFRGGFAEVSMLFRPKHVQICGRCKRPGSRTAVVRRVNNQFCSMCIECVREHDAEVRERMLAKHREYDRLHKKVKKCPTT